MGPPYNTLYRVQCVRPLLHIRSCETDGVALVTESNPLKAQAGHVASVVTDHGACLQEKDPDHGLQQNHAKNPRHDRVLK